MQRWLPPRNRRLRLRTGGCKFVPQGNPGPCARPDGGGCPIPGGPARRSISRLHNRRRRPRRRHPGRRLPRRRLLGLDADPMAIKTAVREPRRASATVSSSSRQTSANSSASAVRTASFPSTACCSTSAFRPCSSPMKRAAFAFQVEAPLDMRFSPSQTLTAIRNRKRIRRVRPGESSSGSYGEEAASRRIARAIIQPRPVETTTQLASIISRDAGRTARAPHSSGNPHLPGAAHRRQRRARRA